MRPIGSVVWKSLLHLSHFIRLARRTRAVFPIRRTPPPLFTGGFCRTDRLTGLSYSNPRVRGATLIRLALPPAEEEALTDRALVDAVLRKDRKATAEFMARHADPVYSYLCRRLLPREDLVEDLFQQVFLDAWQSLSRWREESTLRTWLLGIARHKVQDVYRARLKEAEMPGEEAPEPPETADPSSWLESKHRREQVRETLQRLPEQARILLLWRYWEHQSAEQMASQLGKTVKAVERALARAREQFRRIWRERGHDE